MTVMQIKTEAVLKATLSNRLISTHYVRLYSLDSFYIEVFLDDRTHLITHIEASAGTECLYPYISQYPIAV